MRVPVAVAAGLCGLRRRMVLGLGRAPSGLRHVWGLEGVAGRGRGTLVPVVQANAARRRSKPRARVFAHAQVLSRRRVTVRPPRVMRAAMCKMR